MGDGLEAADAQLEKRAAGDTIVALAESPSDRPYMAMALCYHERDFC